MATGLEVASARTPSRRHDRRLEHERLGRPGRSPPRGPWRPGRRRRTAALSGPRTPPSGGGHPSRRFRGDHRPDSSAPLPTYLAGRFPPQTAVRLSTAVSSRARFSNCRRSAGNSTQDRNIRPQVRPRHRAVPRTERARRDTDSTGPPRPGRTGRGARGHCRHRVRVPDTPSARRARQHSFVGGFAPTADVLARSLGLGVHGADRSIRAARHTWACGLVTRQIRLDRRAQR